MSLLQTSFAGGAAILLTALLRLLLLGKLPAQDYELFVRNCGYGGCESAAISGAVGIILNGGVSSWLARQFGG